MYFLTLKQAEDYYMEHYAKTNNMHGEEEAALEQWLSEQIIEECL